MEFNQLLPSSGKMRPSAVVPPTCLCHLCHEMVRSGMVGFRPGRAWRYAVCILRATDLWPVRPGKAWWSAVRAWLLAPGVGFQPTFMRWGGGL